MAQAEFRVSLWPFKTCVGRETLRSSFAEVEEAIFKMCVGKVRRQGDAAEVEEAGTVLLPPFWFFFFVAARLVRLPYKRKAIGSIPVSKDTCSAITFIYIFYIYSPSLCASHGWVWRNHPFRKWVELAPWGIIGGPIDSPSWVHLPRLLT